MIEEIYEWNAGYANKTDYVLESELIIDDPTGTILQPSFNTDSPYNPITEDFTSQSGTTVTTLVRWQAPDRGSLVNALDRAAVGSYRLEYGIVTDPSQGSPENRVAIWLDGGTRIADSDVWVQGPIPLETLYKDENTDYDFRVRSVTFNGRASVWAYYSTDIGTDYTPSAPPTSTNTLYYIKATNGTAIKNGSGTLTVEARELAGGVDTLLSSGTIQLFDPSNDVVTVANGYASPSDGYTGTLDTGDIAGSKVITLKDGISGQALDTITLVDIDDGSDGGPGADAVYGYIEPTNGVAWTQATNGGAWSPSATTTNLDVTFVQGGNDVARWSRRVDRDANGILTDGGAIAHASGNLNTSRISVVVSQSPYDQSFTVEYTYTLSPDVVVVAETVITSIGADDGSDGADGADGADAEFYYIKPINGTAIKNGSGTLTIEAHHVTGGTDVLLSSGTIRLYDPSNDIVNTANGYLSPSDGYTGTLGTSDISDSIVITLKDGVGGTALDTITLVDIDDGLDGNDGSDAVYGYIEPTNGLAWTQAPNGGAWSPTATSTNLDITFIQSGVDVARRSYQVDRDSSGILTGGGFVAHSSGDLNSSRITAVVTQSPYSQAFTVEFTYTLSPEIVTIAETVITSIGGDDGASGEFYYIKPINGTAIKNGSGTLTLEAHHIVGGIDTHLSSGTIQLFDPSNDIVNTANGYSSPSDGYTGTLGTSDISGAIIITLKDGAGGIPLDTVTLVDVDDGAAGNDGADGADGIDSVYGYIEPTNGLAWTQATNGGAWSPTATSTNLDVTFVKAGIEVARRSYQIDRDSNGILTDGGYATHTSGNLNPSTITAVVTQSPYSQAFTVEFTYSNSPDLFIIAETAITSRGGDDGLDGADGSDGAEGIDARAINLTSGKLAFNYLSDDTLNDSGTTITATALNTTGTPYYEFFEDDVSVANGLSNTYSYTPESSYTNMPDKIEVALREGGPSGTIYARDQITVFGVKPGVDAPLVIQTNEAHTIPRDNLGTYDYTDSGNTIEVYIGTTKLAYDSTSPYSNGSFRVTNVVDTNITVGTPTENANDITYGDADAMLANTASITYTIVVVNNEGIETTITRVQSFSRSTDGDDGSAGADAEFYYIKPLNGTAIKNGSGTLTIEAHHVTGGTDVLLTSGTIQLFDPSNDVVTVANGYLSPSDGYTGTLGTSEISGSIVITLKDGISGQALDTITLADIDDGLDGNDGADGDDAVYGYIEPTNGLAWTQAPNGGAWSPSALSTNFDVTFVQAGSEVARRSYKIDRDGNGILTDGGYATHTGGNLNPSTITAVVTQSPYDQSFTVEFTYSNSPYTVVVAETAITSIGGSDGSQGPTGDDAELYYIKATNGTAIKNGSGTLTLEARHVTGGSDVLLSSGTIRLYDPSNDIVNTANGYPSPSDGYTGTLGTTEISGSIVITLKDGVGGTALDTITLVDVDDGATGGEGPAGADAIYGYIEPTNGLAWTRDPNSGPWNPTATSTNLDVTFVQGGSEVARRSYQVDRDTAGILTGGGYVAHSSGNLNPSTITAVVTQSPYDQSFTVEFTYSFSPDVIVVGETVITSQGGDDGLDGDDGPQVLLQQILVNIILQLKY
jgi:hypothetical protein